VRANNIGVLAVDPFAESHTLEENSNPQMIQAAAAWRRVASAGNCAVLLAHHVRKGLVESIEASRGAKALTDSARIGLLLSTMTEQEADALGIPPETRLQYVRLDDAKANMSARAPKAAWFHLGHVTLDNADASQGGPYVKGDQVVVIEAWQPPSAFDDLTDKQCNDVLDRIAAGLPDDALFTDSRRGGSSRWAGSRHRRDARQKRNPGEHHHRCMAQVRAARESLLPRRQPEGPNRPQSDGRQASGRRLVNILYGALYGALWRTKTRRRSVCAIRGLPGPTLWRTARFQSRFMAHLYGAF
jgi:hypothetical protein